MQKNKGISLIVLVITIIVMIVLATTIIISLNNSGIINRANEAVNKTDKAQVQTLASLAWSEAYLNGARTKEELTVEVYKILKNSGITKEDYLLNMSTSGVEVVDADTWDHAYTCTNGVWSTRIESGDEAKGDIVAKLYKTGNKVKLSEEAIEMIGLSLEPDEYKLVITGFGEIGVLLDDETGETSAWFRETEEYNPEDVNSDIPALLGITEVIISGKIEKIENLQLNQPFYFSLKELTIEENASIEDGAFNENTTLTSVIIGDGVTSIGESAFMNCSSLTSVTIGDSVTNIGDKAFFGCNNLTKAIINSGSIGLRSFL